MSDNEVVLREALSLVLETYADMRRRSADEIQAARVELESYLPKLIAEGELDRKRLAVKCLTRLRELERNRRLLRARRPSPTVTA